ncbi:alpha/beta hydrolase [Brucepastera parasyntrophica]|uniref:alpha/beta fold hydrolase n=1 Tax=Brucepastera parasyntrophica TaxID=2880008 RepID=UPI00210E380B|nr:alpha/beta hydrolase [Brucepastera parasyntrophica]ULQ60633.1 alpha/beta hydrolase [Brucepastera parasyntrophica]
MIQKIPYKDGHSLAYAEYGNKNGFPILLQHGLVASIRDYALLDRLIKTGARVICIARPGYGESSPSIMNKFADWSEVIGALIQELQLSYFDILASSSGAPYGYSIGAGFPDNVRNIYVFSGTPALYDDVVLTYWPYPVNKDLNQEEAENTVAEVYFPGIQPETAENDDIRDSMMNRCFGVAQDQRIKYLDWGFVLPEVKSRVFMQHSRTDDVIPYRCAVRTSQLLPNCSFELLGDGPHFSPEAFEQFIEKTIAVHF